MVVNIFTILVHWVVIFPRLEGHGKLNDVQIHIVQLQRFQRPLQGWSHQLWWVESVPELSTVKDVLSPHDSLSDLLSDGLTHLMLIKVNQRPVKVPVTHIDGQLDALPSCASRRRLWVPIGSQAQ